MSKSENLNILMKQNMNNSAGPTTFTDFGTTWYLGKSETEPLTTCLLNAKSLKHKFIVAYDWFNDQTGTTTKIFGSYKNPKTFFKATKKIDPEERCFYVVVPEKVNCCLYADLEWSLDWKSPEEIKSKFIQVVSDTSEIAGFQLDEEDFVFSNACETATNKGSLHAHVPSIFFNNTEEQQRFFNAVKLQLDETQDWTFIDETDKNYILKTFIDFGVYNKNRQMRLPYSSKRKKNCEFGQRPLIPENEDDFDITEWAIVDTSLCDEEPVNVCKFPSEITCTKRTQFSKALVQGILDSQHLDVTVDTFKGSNLISLKNKTAMRTCPINGEENKTDNAYIVIRDNKLHYHCHDEGCKGQSKIIHEFTEECEVFAPEPPFKKYFWDYEKHKQVFKFKDEDGSFFWTPEYYQWEKNLITEFNKYCVVITGSPMPYVLYRVETKTVHGKLVSWIPKKFVEFNKAYSQYKILSPHSNLKKSLTNLWLESPLRRTYLHEDCKPLAPNTVNPDNVFNTYQGLAITKEKAMALGNTDPTVLTNFIRDSWCDGDTGLFNHVLNYFAHLVQKPWVKMKSNLVLQGLEGVGKGMIVQLLGKIIGGEHFFQPSSQEDMFGQFNYLLDNRLLCFADEMFWGGDKKKAGQLKLLLTEDTRTSNCKHAPQRRTTNMINWIFSSNEDWVVPAGTRARRYTVCKVNDLLLSYTDAQKKQLYDFCPYSFAKLLYSRNIEGWNPHQFYKTEGLKEQKILSMCAIHRWWMNKIEDNDLDFGNVASKDEIYRDFRIHGGDCYKPNNRVFWLSLSKLHTFVETRPCVKDVFTGKSKQVRSVLLPTLEEVTEKFNHLYDCNMILS